MKKWLTILLVSASFVATAQTVSKVWVADNGKGTYKNPVINADYSDPDAIRVGDDYYMISSSFNHAPGLPILHSKMNKGLSKPGFCFFKSFLKSSTCKF